MANKLTKNAGQKSSQTDIHDYNVFAMHSASPPINIDLHDDIIGVKKCEVPITISGKPAAHKADKKKTIENSLVYIVHV